MATHKLHWISALTFGFALTTGCAKDDSTDETTTNGETGSESGDPSGSMSNSSTNMTTTATTAMTDSSTTNTETGMTISTTEPDTTGEPEPMPNGATCEANEECESGFCFVVGILGGICGECNTDADCADATGGGCSIPNPLAAPPQGAHCNMGEAGAGCMDSAICETDLQCAVILDVPGVLTASTCSECLTDADCMGDLCSPTYDVLNLSGQLTCVAPGSVADGEGCDLDSGTGDMACLSGHCATADVMGLLQLGVCSECAVDGDCADGETCMAPAVDLMSGLVAGTCM